jgi:hypothetical protein
MNDYFSCCQKLKTIMKSIFLCCLIAFLLTGCSHRIARSGYQKQQVSGECNVIIQKDIAVPGDVATLAGGITLGETGLSFNCNEATAMETLKKEACSIDADLVIITEEKRPNLWSSCYRCKAEFYRFSTSEAKLAYSGHPIYDHSEVEKRVKTDRRNNTIIAIAAAATGYLLALMF